MDRAVLGVDRHDLGTGGRPGALDDRGTRDERLLVGERQPPPRLECRHGDREAGEPDDSVDHHVGRHRRGDQAVGAGQHLGASWHQLGQLGCERGIADRDQGRMQRPGLLGQQVDGALRGQRNHLEATAARLDDLDRLGADRPGGADQAHRLGRHGPGARSGAVIGPSMPSPGVPPGSLGVRSPEMEGDDQVEGGRQHEQQPVDPVEQPAMAR